jgi:uncharacterized membrane protein
MKKTVFKNLVLFYIGFTTYISIEVVFRGYSHWLMGICGGLAIVILDKLNDYISWDMDILIQGSIGSLLITAFELIIGLISQAGFLPQMWDYSNMPLSFFNGQCCVLFTFFWLLIVAPSIILLDIYDWKIFNGETPYYKIFGHIVLKFKEKNDE